MTPVKKAKIRIRIATLKHFIKSGTCERCGVECKTDWHHKVYKKIAHGLCREDLVECCKSCHKILDRESMPQERFVEKIKPSLRQSIKEFKVVPVEEWNGNTVVLSIKNKGLYKKAARKKVG